MWDLIKPKENLGSQANLAEDAVVKNMLSLFSKMVLTFLTSSSFLF